MFGNQFKLGSVGVLQHPGYNGGGKSKAPPPPDYAGAAAQTAAGNLETARATAAANRVNQYTPYGSLEYAPTEKDIYGNQLYKVTQTLSPAEQQKLDLSNRLESGLLGTAQSGLDYAQGVLARPGVDMSQLPSVGINPGEMYSEAIMRRLQPNIDRQTAQLETKLLNQGIAPGTQAWQAAKFDQAQAQNDALAAAQIQGMQTGLSAQNQAFNQAAYNQMQPINVINALRTGTQVDNPNFVSPVQQAQTAGPDLLSAAQAQYAGQLGATNAQNAAAGNFMGGLMSLGGAGILKYSDENMKENVVEIGALNNGLKIYSFEYKDEYKDIAGHGRHVGVMAQEVEKVQPDAVVTMPNGLRGVNYSMLGA